MNRTPALPLQIPNTVSEAIGALSAAGPASAVMAGATGIMREEPRDRSYVAIGHLAELRSMEIKSNGLSIGACVTHSEFAMKARVLPGLEVLASAAAKSANPAVRNAATVGGNICTMDFAAADLVPAFLCLGATVEYITNEGACSMAFSDFLGERAMLKGKAIVTRVIVPLNGRRSAHVRLPLKESGDYPIAIVSVAVTLNDAGQITDATVAVGAVEAAARRWFSLENALRGRQVNANFASMKARELSGEFQGRDEPDAPGWYRVQVLPTLVGRGFDALRS